MELKIEMVSNFDNTILPLNCKQTLMIDLTMECQLKENPPIHTLIEAIRGSYNEAPLCDVTNQRFQGSKTRIRLPTASEHSIDRDSKL